MLKWLGEIIRKFRFCCHKWVDYTQMYLSLISNPGNGVEALNCHLEAVMDWMKANKQA